MKKIKILSFASLPLAMALLAGCGHTHTFSEEWNHDANKHWHDATCEHKDQVSEEGEHVFGNDNICDVCGYDKGGEPGPGPTPVSGEVTSDEWDAAFGRSKPFYIADNYKLVATMSSEGQSSTAELIADGYKLQSNELEDGKVFTLYNEIVEGQKYVYNYDSETKKWTRVTTQHTMADDMVSSFLPFGQNYSKFTYDDTTKSYKCASISFEGQALTNLTIKFENKQIKELAFDTTQEGHLMHMTFALTYGGQTVTLPEIEQPEPGAAVYGYNLNGSGYVAMIHEDKNNQWLALDISVSKDDTITFANISGSLQEPAVLKTLYCDGETQGFAISEGVLTAGEDGTYSFIISPEETKDRITIEKQESPAPETNCRLMGLNGDWEFGLSMQPTTEGSTEFVANNLDIKPGDKLKIKFGDDWINKYKNGGVANAIDERLAEIDGDQNISFNYGGVYTIYFESNVEGSFGIFVQRVSVTCPYVGSAELTDPYIIRQDARFFFHKVDVANNFIEYYLSNCPAFSGMAYTIKNDDTPVDFTFEDTAGEGPNFDKVGSTLTYRGSAKSLTFYVKEDLTEHTLTVYVEAYVDPAMYNTLYLNPGDWANDGATFFAYFFDSTGTNTAIWVALTSEDSLYKVDKVEGYDKVIFVRCDPTKDPLVDGWDAKWNQTDDLDVPSDANVKCTITGWGEPGGNSTVSWGTK